MMTRQDIVTALRDLIAGRRRSIPEAWTLEDGVSGIRLSVEGTLFEIEVSDVGEDAVDFDTALDAMSPAERDAFARELDEAAEEAERDGPVPAEDLRRCLDEAIERGLELRARAGRAPR